MNQIKAAAVYMINLRETREHYQARADALYERWLASEMGAVERDREMAALRAAQARHLALEGEIYRLNLASSD